MTKLYLRLLPKNMFFFDQKKPRVTASPAEDGHAHDTSYVEPHTDTSGYPGPLVETVELEKTLPGHQT
jgi:hypothetical protein